MPYLELSLRCTEAEQPRYERALEDVGALAVTLLDADADTPNERAILEPGVGQTPVWKALVLTALFDADTDALALLAALEAFDPAWNGAAPRSARSRTRTGNAPWLDQFQPMRFGERTWIVPGTMSFPPKRTFRRRRWCGWIPAWPSVPAPTRPPRCACAGSTPWPATACCAVRACSTSGAARASSRWPRSSWAPPRAVGVDNDPQAVQASLDNTQRNAVGERFAVYLPQDEPVATYPVVVANILAVALDALAEVLAARVAPGGRIALSGILRGRNRNCCSATPPGSTTCRWPPKRTGCGSTAYAVEPAPEHRRRRRRRHA